MLNLVVGDVYFKNDPQHGKALRIELHQSVGQHDLAVLTMTYISNAAQYHRTGNPVSFQFGIGQHKTWVGYLHTTVPGHHHNTGRTVIHCLGATYPLSNSHHRVWRKGTASAIVSQICHERRIVATVTPTQRVYTQLHQAGRTDWQFINHLASENARLVIPNGPSVRFVSKDVVLKSFDRLHSPTLAWRASHERDILSYKIEHSEDSGHGVRHAQHSVSGVDARSGRIVHFEGAEHESTFAKGEKNTRPFKHHRTHTTAISHEEAHFLHEAATLASSWKYRLHVRARGSVAYAPGVMVAVTGIGSYASAYMIESVTHILDGKGHVCEMELVADSIGSPVYAPTTVSGGSASDGGSTPAPPYDNHTVCVLHEPEVTYALRDASGLVMKDVTHDLSELTSVWQATTAAPLIPKPSGHVEGNHHVKNICRRATRVHR